MSKVSCSIITIGDEILFGHILDTNSKWLSQELNKVGVKILEKKSIENEFSVSSEKMRIIFHTSIINSTEFCLVSQPRLSSFRDTAKDNVSKTMSSMMQQGFRRETPTASSTLRATAPPPVSRKTFHAILEISVPFLEPPQKMSMCVL